MIKQKKESIMTPTGKPYEHDYTKRNELDPIRCFVLLDKNSNPLLSRGGIIITNAFNAEEQIQLRADNLYNMNRAIESIYMIENEKYDECTNIKDTKEYVSFVKKNGKLIKKGKNYVDFNPNGMEDDDFLLDVKVGDFGW